MELFALGGMKYAGKQGLKYLLTEGVKQLKKTPQYVKPAADFSRGVVMGKPKYLPIGESGATQATITASLRAGIQTRYLAGKAAELAIVKSPRAALGTAKYLARSAIKDVTWPYDVAYFGYKAATLGRQARFVSSGAERGIEAFFSRGNKFLNALGVAPSYRGLAGVITRGSVYIALGTGLYNAEGAVDAIYLKAKKYLAQASDAAATLGTNGVPSSNGGGAPTIPMGGNTPVGSPPVVPVIPVNPVPAGNPLPAPRQRRYIPTGGG